MPEHSNSLCQMQPRRRLPRLWAAIRTEAWLVFPNSLGHVGAMAPSSPNNSTHFALLGAELAKHVSDPKVQLTFIGLLATLLRNWRDEEPAPDELAPEDIVRNYPSGCDDERGGEKFSEPGALFYERAAACAAAVSERSRARSHSKARLASELNRRADRVQIGRARRKNPEDGRG